MTAHTDIYHEFDLDTIAHKVHRSHTHTHYFWIIIANTLLLTNMKSKILFGSFSAHLPFIMAKYHELAV